MVALFHGTRWNPTLAVDGLDALALYEAGSFDLVLTDLNMPKMDGGRLARAVKRINPQQPVAILTGVAIAGSGATGLEAADVVLKKPISKKALLSALDLLVSDHAQ